MNETIEEWLSLVTSSDYKVWVENPETIKESGFMGKSYTTFRILLKSSESELIAIRHRFSEFVLLRDILRDRYTQYGILVPSLPQKKVIGALDKEFVTERMHGLTLFSEALVANPWLRKDPVWYDFMTSALPPSGPKKGQEAVKTPSEQMLQNILDRLPIPSTPLERIYELKEEINALEKQLQAILDATRVVQKQQAALSLATQSLHAAFEGWSAIETNPTSIYLNARSYEANSCQMKLRDEEKVPILVSKMTSSLQDRVSATQDLSEYSSILLSTYIEHELARIYSIKELVKYHDDLVTAIDTQRVKVEKMEVQPSAKIDQLQELKKQLEIKKLTLNSFYKGFYFFSLPLNAKLRSSNIRKIVSNYGATKLVASYTLLKSSKLLLSELLISPTSAISDTSQILDILALKPLDEPPEGLPGPNEGLDTTPSWIESLYYSALQSITAPGFIPAPIPAPPISSPTSPNLKASSNNSNSTPATNITSSPSTNNNNNNNNVESDLSTLIGGNSKNPFDNVDVVVSGTSIGGGELKKSTNPFDDNSSTSSPSSNHQSSNSNDIKIVPVSSPVKVNQNLLGDLLGGNDGKKDDKSSIWG